MAANASRRRWLNAERLQQRLPQLQVARPADAQGDLPAEVPAWLAKTPQSRTAPDERYRQAQEHLAEWHAAHQHPSPSERRAPDKLVVSPGAPEAALGVDQDHGLRPWSTIQTVRDGDAPWMLGDDVFAHATAAGT